MKNLTALQKEMLRVLTNTKNFYNKNPNKRAVNDYGICAYETSDGCRCAVGRFLTKRDLKHLYEEGLIIAAGPEDIQNEVKSKIFHRLPIEFWENLQSFHDLGKYWDNNGITEEGLQEYERIKANILDGVYF